jgi:hypothetical protein
MIHQQIAVTIEVPTRIAVRVEHEKTDFAADKKRPHSGLGDFMGKAALGSARFTPSARREAKFFFELVFPRRTLAKTTRQEIAREL